MVSPAYLRADVSGLSGHGVASGTVNFTDNGSGIGTGIFTLNSDGTASTAQGVFTIPVGQHSDRGPLQRRQLGFNASTSAAVPITVDPGSDHNR